MLRKMHRSSEPNISKSSNSPQNIESTTTIAPQDYCKYVTFEETNIAFDIQENRRRRAELAKDVNDLINISKFFQQHYADDFVTGNDFANKKNDRKSNANASTKHKNWSCVTSKISGKNERHNLTKRVAVLTETDAICQQTTTADSNDLLEANTALPPVFDVDQLDEYCEYIVDDFFNAKKANNKTNDNVKLEKHENLDHTKSKLSLKNSKYASVSARYLDQVPKKPCEKLPHKSLTARSRLFSAKSKSILEEVNRKGIKIKKHSCINHETEAVPNRKVIKKKLSARSNQSLENFQKSHPNIDLVPGSSLFPKRIIKISNAHNKDLLQQYQNDMREVNEIVNFSDNIEMPTQSNKTEISSSATADEINLNIQGNTHITVTQNLQMQKMPIISIKSESLCEVHRVYEIAIQPNNGLKNQDNEKLIRKNIKVVQLTYNASSDIPADKVDENAQLRGSNDEKLNNSTDLLSDNLSISSLRFQISNDTHRTDDFNNKETMPPTNKYFTPFMNGFSTIQELTSRSNSMPLKEVAPTEIQSDNKLSFDSSIDDSLSINLSTTSHMTDDEKFKSDKSALAQRYFSFRNSTKKNLHECNKDPIKCVLNEIFETDQLESAEDKTNYYSKVSERDSERIPESIKLHDDTLELREILDKIRNDKTSLDLAIETRNTYQIDFDKFASMSVSPKVSLTTNNKEKTNVLQKLQAEMHDQEIQCDSIAFSHSKTNEKNFQCIKRQITSKKKKKINAEQMNSPKFTKTVNSIRSSAKKLDFDSAGGKYKSATKEQIQMAAKRFLNSILKEKDYVHRTPTIDNDSDAASSIQYQVLKPPIYHVIDDQICQSHFNSVLDTLNHDDSNIDDCSITSIDYPFMNLNLLSMRNSTSSITPPNSFRILDKFSNGEHNGNISDGEVLSEGEIRADEDDKF